MNKKNIFLSVLPLVIISFISCRPKTIGSDADAKKKICVSDSLAKLIRIDTVHISSFRDEIKLTGEVSFNDNKVVRIYPFSSGQVQKVFVSVGDKVKQGTVLAIIKSADVSGAYSDLSAANTDLAIAKKQMDNEESLFKNGIASEREFTEAKENYNKALASVSKIKDQIAINGGGRTSESGTYVVAAPITGYVVEKNVQAGSFIRGDNSQNLFTIGDISNVWIWANVYETDVAKVKEGYTAEVSTLAYPGKIFKGKVDKTNEMLDADAKVMKVRIALQNDSLQLKPEMFANVLVKNQEIKNMHSIPASAIITENGKNYVVVYRDRCDLAIKLITIYKTINGIAYISNGLEADEKIISQNQVLLFRALTEE